MVMSFLNTLAVTAGISMIFFSYTFYLVLEIDFSILKKNSFEISDTQDCVVLLVVSVPDAYHVD